MKVLKSVFLASLALALVLSVTEARSHRRHNSRKQQEEEQPVAEQVQQENPEPVEIEPAQSQEATSGSGEKSRPARARKTPIACNANAAAATLAKPDQVETNDDKTSFEVIEPASPESLEIEPIPIREPIKARKLEKPKGKVIPASSEESSSPEGDDDGEKENESGGNNFSAALESLEEPAPPKALTNKDVPDEDGSRAVESEEEKPKARRSKHNRKDIRKIERPYRRRVVFHSSDEE